MTAVLSRLRSVWTLTRDLVGPDGESDDGREEQSPDLFHCDSCGVVYIATEKDGCSNCTNEVEQVSSTLSPLEEEGESDADEVGDTDPPVGSA